MSTTPTTTPNKEVLENRERTFILYYHYRSSKPLELVFYHKGDLTSAIEEGRRHCEVMNYRFIKVRPFIVDLKDREKRRLEENYVDEN